MLSVALSLNPSPRRKARRALPGTVVPWSPDFPRPTRRQAAVARSPDAARYGLLRARQQEREQFGAALAVDDAVDALGAEAALEGDCRLERVGHVIAEAF